jgi:hypothetical protein
MVHIKAKQWKQAAAVYRAALKEFPGTSTLKNNLKFCERKAKEANPA